MRFPLILSAALVGMAAAPAPIPAPVQAGQSMQPTQGIVCFFRRDRLSGANLTCYYDCMGSEAATTISSAEICPPTITR